MRKGVPNEPRNLVGGLPIGIGRRLGIRHNGPNGILHRNGHEVCSGLLKEGRCVVGLILPQRDLLVPHAMLTMDPLHGEIERLPLADDGEAHRGREAKLELRGEQLVNVVLTICHR